jgi:hypothetical protein
MACAWKMEEESIFLECKNDKPIYVKHIIYILLSMRLHISVFT